MRRAACAASISTIARGMLTRAYPYARAARGRAAAACRLIAAGVKPGDRVALIAETGPEFAALFFGAVYAGAWPVPLPLPTSFGGRDSYIEQLGVQLQSCRPDAAPLSRPSSPRWPARPPRRRASTGIAWERFAEAPAPRGRACPRPGRTTSPICNIRAARPASRTASRSPTARCSPISPRTATACICARHRPLHLLAALVSRHGPGRLPALAWSPTRSRPIISRPRISPAARSPGST